MVLFKDINKAAADVITKDFPHEKSWEAEVKSKSGNFFLTTTAQVDAAKAFDANTAFKHATKDSSFEAKVFANGSSSFDFKYTLPEKCRSAAGLILSSRFERKKGGKAPTDLLELSGEYSHKLAHAKLAILPLTSSFNGSALFVHKAFKAGTEVSGRFDFATVNYSVGASYTPNPNLTASVKTVPDAKSAFAKVVGNAHVKSNGTEVGAELNYDIANAKALISVGGKFDFDKNTAIKAKLGHDAKAAVAVTHVLSPFVTSTLGFQFDAANPTGADSIKYGAKFSFSH